MGESEQPHVVVIGAGFCGLAAAYELGRYGVRVTVVERDADIGGLAGSFQVGSVRLEKFYHHWFTNDLHVMRLIEELGKDDRVLLRATRTGMYFANNFFKLSTPLDLLRFTPLPFRYSIRCLCPGPFSPSLWYRFSSRSGHGRSPPSWRLSWPGSRDSRSSCGIGSSSLPFAKPTRIEVSGTVWKN